MEIIQTAIPDVKVIKSRIFQDGRGCFLEAFKESTTKDAGIDVAFVQDNISVSHKGTVRGLHYQIEQPQAKLVRVLKGRIIDVAVDLRKSSPTFGKHVAVELDSESHHALYVPVGFAHGFSVLSEEAVFYYKCSDYYNKAGERGLLWSDESLGIDWKVSEPLLSDKDKIYPKLNQIKAEDLFE